MIKITRLSHSDTATMLKLRRPSTSASSVRRRISSDRNIRSDGRVDVGIQKYNSSGDDIAIGDNVKIDAERCGIWSDATVIKVTLGNRIRFDTRVGGERRCLMVGLGFWGWGWDFIFHSFLYFADDSRPS